MTRSNVVPSMVTRPERVASCVARLLLKVLETSIEMTLTYAWPGVRDIQWEEGERCLWKDRRFTVLHLINDHARSAANAEQLAGAVVQPGWMHGRNKLQA